MGTFEALFSGGGVTAAAVWRLLLGAAHPRPGLCTWRVPWWRVAVMSGGGGTATGTECPLTLGDAGAILSYKVGPALNFQLTTEFKLLKIHRWHRTMYCLNK